MRFGTPLSPNAVKVMLLGAGELGKEVIIELQRHRLDARPGRTVAKQHLIRQDVEDMRHLTYSTTTAAGASAPSATQIPATSSARLSV